jgi:Flp pilus assembly protein TadG
MRSFRKTSGQSLLEFALILPLLLVLVMGLFEFGRAVFYYAALNNAAREGTRVAIVQPECDLRIDDDCEKDYKDNQTLTCATASSTANTRICAEIKNKLFNLPELLDSSRTTITIDHTVNSADEPIIHVRINHLFQPIVPGLNLIGNINLRAESQMLKTPLAKP